MSKKYIAIPGTHCGDRPIILIEPEDRDMEHLLKFWWRNKRLPYAPKPGPGYVENHKKLMEISFSFNKAWFENGLIERMPSDFVMRWQRPFALWLVENFDYQIVETNWLTTTHL
jgi:hypothetical protein